MPKNPEITDYTWTQNDYHLYYEGVHASYGDSVVFIRNFVPHPNTSLFEKVVVTNTKTNRETEVSLDELSLSKPPGIALNTPGFAPVYVTYKPTPHVYKKGVHNSEYKIWSPYLSALSNLGSIAQEQISKQISAQNKLDYLSAVVSRKTNKDLDMVAKAIKGENLGAILNEDYFISRYFGGMTMFYKNHPIGIIIDGKLDVKASTPTLRALCDEAKLRIS